MIETVAQIIGILAMAMNCLAFQQKKRNTVIIFQFIGTVLFSINFFMLDASTGAILNAIAAIRAIIYIYKDKLHADRPIWLAGFFSIYVASYAATFLIFDKEPTVKNLAIEILPVIGMVLTNIGFLFNDAKSIRKFAFFNSPFWLTYDIFSGSIGAIVCECISIVSIIIGTLRLDIKKKK